MEIELILKKKRRQKKTPLSTNEAQEVAINALLGTLARPDAINSDIECPETIINLIYAGANHLAIRAKNSIKGKGGDPTEMRVRVVREKDITETQVGFNFLSSMFTIYTPLDIGQEIKRGDISLTLGDILRNQIVDLLPSAGARFSLTIGLVCSQRGTEEYIKKYLPTEFKKNSRNKVKRNKKSKGRP